MSSPPTTTSTGSTGRDASQARVLVIGHGGMGRMYAEALRARDALAGIVVRTEASATRIRERAREQVGTSFERLVEETTPSAVAIFTTTEWHSLYLREAIRRGLPALVIKPACTLPATARALHDEAGAAEVPVLVAHEGVFQPAFATLERAIHEGRIGAVREVQWIKEGEDQLSGGRRREAERPEDAAGRNYGYLYATTMHDLYAANRLAGRTAPSSAEVLRVRASATTPRLDARVRYPDGLTARIRYHVAPGVPFRRGLHVIGQRGSLLWMVEPGKTTLQHRLGRDARDLPFHGFTGSNPGTPVVDELLRVIAGEVAPSEQLIDGARALEAARLLTAAAARHDGAELRLDAVAGGTDR